ncbi:glycosyltransferase family 4 protein [Gordonia westfalica]|nr:glycosyltransferase [Gordonia westfalica]
MMLISDEWRSGRGGLSTMNRELATALASAGVETAVMVPRSTDEDIKAASDVDVALVTPASIPGLNSRELLLLRPVFADSSWEPDVIIGHGRVLGSYAAAQKQQFFSRARRVHFVHTDAEQLEAAKEMPGGTSRMASADERRNLERDLARSADLVVGVGPMLTATITDDLIGLSPRPKIMCMVPGLRSAFDPASASPPVRNALLVVGRADDFQSKGIDIVADALLKVVDRWPQSRPHPPVLVLRGVPGEAATDVKARLDEIFEGRVAYHLRPYSDSEELVKQDLAQSRVMLMPSRHEGFGLAAFEAIASDIPVLISAESGLAQFLRESHIDTEPSSIVTTRNTSTRLAIDEWADAIWYVLTHPAPSRAQAHEMRKRLSEIVDWRTAVDYLLAELDGLD